MERTRVVYIWCRLFHRLVLAHSCSSACIEPAMVVPQTNVNNNASCSIGWLCTRFDVFAPKVVLGCEVREFGTREIVFMGFDTRETQPTALQCIYSLRSPTWTEASVVTIRYAPACASEGPDLLSVPMNTTTGTHLGSFWYPPPPFESTLVNTFFAPGCLSAIQSNETQLVKMVA